MDFLICIHKQIRQDINKLLDAIHGEQERNCNEVQESGTSLDESFLNVLKLGRFDDTLFGEPLASLGDGMDLGKGDPGAQSREDDDDLRDEKPSSSSGVQRTGTESRLVY